MRLKKIVIIPLLITGVLFAFTSPPSFGQERSKMHPAMYWQKIRDNIIRCVLCPRKCILGEGQRGVCTVRINKGGELYTLGYANPVAVHVDPIEKKPFFHVLPGSRAFSIAVAGCNMRCLFCQNWQISQARPDETRNYHMPPEVVVEEAIKNDCASVVYTYTEPTVFYEYMLDTAKLAREKGLLNAMHTCGYIEEAPLKELLKYMDAVDVDLKAFNEDFYREMGMLAQLEPVLRTLKTVKDQGEWLEITNLIIPGKNDSPDEIRRMCRWIRENLGDDVPIHLSRFRPAFNLRNLPPTPQKTMETAYRIAREEGLKYVYIGNMPGNQMEDTICPACNKVLVKRIGYKILENNIKDNKCAYCGEKVSGIWSGRRSQW